MLPERIKNQLKEDFNKPTIRITFLSTIGTYAISLASYSDEYLVDMCHWQHHPLDEAFEQTTIMEQSFQDYKEAFKCLVSLVTEEYELGCTGYNLSLPEDKVYRAKLTGQ